jgi:hypothetical protein
MTQTPLYLGRVGLAALFVLIGLAARRAAPVVGAP